MYIEPNLPRSLERVSTVLKKSKKSKLWRLLVLSKLKIDG